MRIQAGRRSVHCCCSGHRIVGRNSFHSLHERRLAPQPCSLEEPNSASANELVGDEPPASPAMLGLLTLEPVRSVSPGEQPCDHTGMPRAGSVDLGAETSLSRRWTFLSRQLSDPCPDGGVLAYVGTFAHVRTVDISKTRAMTGAEAVPTQGMDNQHHWVGTYLGPS